jgi:hypothetical protein
MALKIREVFREAPSLQRFAVQIKSGVNWPDVVAISKLV